MFHFIDSLDDGVAPIEVAGLDLVPVNPSGVNMRELLHQPLPKKLPVGKHGFEEGLSEHLDSTRVWPALELAFRVWMSNEIRGGGEDGTHYRNDGLLKIMMLVGGLTFFDRNNAQSTTKGISRQDVTLGFQNIPLVHVEEKRVSVADGVADLRNKLHWIPNLSQLPFIYGLAISATTVQIWNLTSQGITDATPLFTTSLTSTLERMNAVVAIAQCGRVLRHFHESDMVLLGSGMAFNQWHVRLYGNKSVKFADGFVHVRYDEETLANMVEFYRANDTVEHLEHMVDFDDEKRTVRLQPMGVNRLPATAMDVIAMRICVLTCLRGLHANGFYHTDLRWSNIVWVRDGKWCVIDCTNFVRADGAEDIRLGASSRCPLQYRFDGSPWSVKHELFQVGRLIEHVILMQSLADAHFVTWKTNCLNGVYGSADELLDCVHAQLK